jgi:hypothetical protein
MEATRDLEGLTLGASRGRVRGEVARGGEQRERGVVRAGEELVLADGCLDALDGVEVAVLADERRAERGDEPGPLAAGAEEGGDPIDRTLGRAWRIVGNSPSQCLCHSRNGATGSTFAQLQRPQARPTSILTQGRQRYKRGGQTLKGVKTRIRG